MPEAVAQSWTFLCWLVISHMAKLAVGWGSLLCPRQAWVSMGKKEQ